MIDVFDIARAVNVALLVVLLAGLAAARWRSRRRTAHPLGIATVAFACALLYGSVEAIAQDTPPGGRPILTLAATIVANVCVYIPLLHRPRKDMP